MKNIKNFVCPIIAFIVFAVFTALVKTIDVQTIGPEGSSVGFAAVNQAVLNALSDNHFMYTLTEYIGYFALAVMFLFACVGLYQLVKGKSLKAVDPRLYTLAGFYVIMLAFYALFEVLVINYRPMILDEGLEASYPSSHTMLAICVMVSATFQFGYLLENKFLCRALSCVAYVVCVVAVIGRLMSGVHWFTDIIGGVLLSFALIALYASVMKIVTDKYVK